MTPKSKATLASADKDLANLKAISKRHQQKHKAILMADIDWSAVSAEVGLLMGKQSKLAITKLSDLTKM